ncbi:thyrotropin-releasing hormone receptor-like [Littorina saxatilis]|uniref:thyrotropin-releasing hormone receptor-like n=1 Tax=Littorina saxatilis TaxID=31220 RepID=UPI0038B60226
MLESSPGTSRSSNDDVTTGSTRQELDPYYVDEFLNQKNAEYVSNSVPTIVFLVVLMVAGIVGNTLVFNVYYRRFKPSVSRTCIMAMSNIDFLFNVCAIPLQITEICFNATFYSVWACKMSRSVTLFLVLFSAMVLVAVSVERQKVICSKQHLSLKSGYLCILYCGVASFVLALPYAVLTGKSTRRFPDSNITGAQCSISDEYTSSAFLIVYNSMVALAYVLCVVIMSVSYGRIVRDLSHHKQIMATFKSAREKARRNNCWFYFKKRRSNARVKTEFQQRQSDEYAEEVRVSYVTERSVPCSLSSKIKRHCKKMDEEQTTTSLATDATLSPSRPDSNTTTQLQTDKISEVKGQVKDIPKSTTIMMFVLTVMFVSTYLPYLVIKMLDQRTSGEFTRSLDLNLSLIGLRFHFINSAVNPIVYCFCSRRFRYECRRLFWDKRSCKNNNTKKNKNNINIFYNKNSINNVTVTVNRYSKEHAGEFTTDESLK